MIQKVEEAVFTSKAFCKKEDSKINQPLIKSTTTKTKKQLRRLLLKIKREDSQPTKVITNKDATQLWIN